MKIEDLLNMENGEAIPWLEKNKNSIALVPRELTLEIRKAFHESHEDCEEGNEIEGSPDDEWAAMINVIEST